MCVACVSRLACRGAVASAWRQANDALGKVSLRRLVHGCAARSAQDRFARTACHSLRVQLLSHCTEAGFGCEKGPARLSRRPCNFRSADRRCTCRIELGTTADAAGATCCMCLNDGAHERPRRARKFVQSVAMMCTATARFACLSARSALMQGRSGRIADPFDTAWRRRWSK